MNKPPKDLSLTALECVGGPFHGQLLGIADRQWTITVRVGSLRIHYSRHRGPRTFEPQLHFTGAEVEALAGLTRVTRPASRDEAMWAGVPRA